MRCVVPRRHSSAATVSGAAMSKPVKSKPDDLLKDAMSKNGRGNSHVNVPDEYAKAQWAIENPPSLAGLKLLLLIIAACEDDLDGVKEFPASMLREVPALAHASPAEFKVELQRLMAGRIRTPFLLLGNRIQEMFGVIISDAVLTYGDEGDLHGFAILFGETFKEMIRLGQLYTVLDASVVLAMRSRHSVLLYQFLAVFWRKRSKTMDVPISELRRLFVLSDDSYPLFGRLKEKVLLPACAEISALSPYEVMAEPLLQNRKAVGVRFHWEAKAVSKPVGSPPAAAAAKGGKATSKSSARRGKPSAFALSGSSDSDVLAFHADRVKRKAPGVSSMNMGLVRKLIAAGLVTPADLRAANLPVC